MKTLILIAIVIFVAVSYPRQAKKALIKSIDGIDYIYTKAKPVAKAISHKAVKAGKEIAKD